MSKLIFDDYDKTNFQVTYFFRTDTINSDPMSKAQFDRLLDAMNNMRKHLEDKIQFTSDMVNFNLMQSETNIRTNTNIVNRSTNKKLDKMHEFNQTSLSLLCQSDRYEKWISLSTQ